MSISNKNAACTIGFFILVTQVLIFLKLSTLINWTWLWIFSPLWLGLSFLNLIVFFYTVFSILFNKSRKG